MRLDTEIIRKLSTKAFLISAFGSALALCNPFAAAGQTVPPPSNGLGGNHNYILSANCVPLTNLKVTINVTQNISAGPASVPINFQLNAWSLATSSSRPTINFQQYMLGVSLNGNYGNTPNQPFVNAAIQNFSSQGRQLNAGQKVVSLPGPGAILPQSYTLVISLHNDNSGNVTGATFGVVDPSGHWHSWKQDLKDISTFSPSLLAPIVAFELNLVGSGFSTGEGTITYDASTPMTVSTTEPSCVESHVTTAESTNSSYGLLPDSPSNGFTQTFQSVSPNLMKNPTKIHPFPPGRESALRP